MLPVAPVGWWSVPLYYMEGSIIIQQGQVQSLVLHEYYKRSLRHESSLPCRQGHAGRPNSLGYRHYGIGVEGRAS